MSGLGLLVASRTYWVSYGNGCIGLLVQRFLLLWNWFHFLILMGVPLVILVGWIIFLPPFIDVVRSMPTVSSYSKSLKFSEIDLDRFKRTDNGTCYLWVFSNLIMGVHDEEILLTHSI